MTDTPSTPTKSNPTKSNPGRFFEDFRPGEEIVHATPRTVTEGDAALYTALYGSRFPFESAATAALDHGFEDAPLDDLLVFHIAFGKTVPDVSLNAVANLGYAGGRFGVPVYAGDTLSTVSRVVGLKENSNRKTGVVYVHSAATNQRGEPVLDYIRWVMVHKRDPESPAPEPLLPHLPEAVDAADLRLPEGVSFAGFDTALTGSPHLWEDYQPGERIDHVDGMTVEEAEHMLATRLYQNTARVHFNQLAQQDSRFGRRLIYGGHVISLARALSFNGLGNAVRLAAINAGSHTNPLFAGDTVFAWSEVVERLEVPGRRDVGALRLKTVATRNQPADAFPEKDENGKWASEVILSFDYTVLMPRRA
ncbi:MaoC family dehydratase [Roseospirillum parvum]|uniref:2-methylfumaryl-CoA hydratase n=1 Tax=Roseospirillum parvum TaxID=83401 RepID=A0A1G7TLA7_9PROT|nr:MaoC family dehydratase [Roseospirillum parvum]SDG35290.1 2-methylfumaryl-CoA hydratase [Roseospirillum parvum]